MKPYSYRQDPRVPYFEDRPAVTIMDAQCGLCAKGARWIAHNDRRKEFAIVPLQSSLGRALIQHYGLNPEDPTSWLFLENGKAYTSLDACIRVARRLGGIWHSALILRLIPASLGRVLYRWVARNRYGFFGRTDLCNSPDPAIQTRLVTDRWENVE